MRVVPHPAWVAQIRFEDGSTVFTDGTKDLFKYYLDLRTYAPSRAAADVTAIYVTDYYTLQFVDATRAFYVTGSDVFGPMGNELVAFVSASSAEEFSRDHHGKNLLPFDAVSPEVLRSLE